ncbi:Hpt domain-containing protein [Salipiger sp.]|uniref:Hpt domain-containing protein n=1 Tax=Salipiger sp. TaxID=2078585 RepID=UPI003A9712C4
MIDWQRVSELRDEIGSEDFDEVVDLFLQEVGSSLADLPSAAGDASALEPLLHFLKGSALNLGFKTLARLCQAGEFAAGAGNARDVDVGLIIQTFDDSRLEFLTELPLRMAA